MSTQHYQSQFNMEAESNATGWVRFNDNTMEIDPLPPRITSSPLPFHPRVLHGTSPPPKGQLKNFLILWNSSPHQFQQILLPHCQRISEASGFQHLQ
ncbi:hypothetical protein PAXRUDRAFT_17738 [Paxillus rubicundulus Ve08.2h10]|uniref:Uncharacterized protein n=1 Tax=Paxillus rubicundulus Ve08.2h10 TaxID=930991 RepID=A0A0D0D0K3_9AGAM|nr:hypothetical protein PAXRUDRAFT_17738 [Paxillus rubicundulus Ve08.2h10]